MGQNHPKFFLSHFIKLSHILANYTKGQVAKLIRTILKMSLELTYRIWITLYNLYYYTGYFYMYIVDILILLVFNQELLLFQIWHWSSFENFGIFGNRCPQQLEAFQTSTEIHSR